jgi:ferritin
MKYQNLRGGRVVLTAINRPAHQEWATPLAAIEFALNLEKQVNQVFKKLFNRNSFNVQAYYNCIFHVIVAARFAQGG